MLFFLVMSFLQVPPYPLCRKLQHTGHHFPCSAVPDSFRVLVSSLNNTFLDLSGIYSVTSQRSLTCSPLGLGITNGTFLETSSSNPLPMTMPFSSLSHSLSSFICKFLWLRPPAHSLSHIRAAQHLFLLHHTSRMSGTFQSHVYLQFLLLRSLISMFFLCLPLHP